MNKIVLLRCLLLIIFVTGLDTHSYSQQAWSGVYGNEWLNDRYAQEWLKIQVSKAGVYRVVLPDNFKDKAAQLHLYHRGKEVSLISASSTEIKFYGVENDGAFDALLYRPYTGVRANPYYSWFSDKSSYFLTFSSDIPSKIVKSQLAGSKDKATETYHLETQLTTFTTSDTYDGSQNIVLHTLDHSYFTEGKGRSSKAYYKRINSDGSTSGDPVFTFPLTLKNIVNNVNQKVRVEIQLNGRTNSSNNIKLSAGQSINNLKELPKKIEFSGFKPYTVQFDLDPDMIDANGKCTIRLESLKITGESSTTGVFSVNYIKIEYPQSPSMSGLKDKVFSYSNTAKNGLSINIQDIPQNVEVLEISDPDNPIKINYLRENGDLFASLNTLNGEYTNILISSSVQDAVIEPVTFLSPDAKNGDYIIITNDNLKSSAIEYGNYRSSVQGGKYNVVIVNIKDVYNQFNYGEPSPVAIKRFIDFMLKDGIRPKHNLLLIGHSTTIWNRMTKDLVQEVPTIGFPGSDILLVDGLAGVPTDVPAIPIGRISATQNSQVLAYLSKVKTYEMNMSIRWKKQILHLSGGKSPSEIQQLAGELKNLTTKVEDSQFGGKVTPFVKKSAIETLEVDITSEVNDGVGWISYYGHGSSTITDYDLGYISDPKRGYANNENFPFMYFNGCGVGNIFNGRNNPLITSDDKLPLSSDWINSEKGSIAVIANSYYSFLSSSSRYLSGIYAQIFQKSTEGSIGIGQVQKNVAAEIVKQSTSEYDISNIHQSILQGDPAVAVMRNDLLDFELDSKSISISSMDETKTLASTEQTKIAIVIRNNGRFLPKDIVTLNLQLGLDGGEIINYEFQNVNTSFQDTLYYVHNSRKRINSIKCYLDKGNLIKEINENNNTAELQIDWNEAANLIYYPTNFGSDLIPPVMDVYVNGMRFDKTLTVSTQNEVKISLADNYPLLPDPSLLEIFLKNCNDGNCDFERMSFEENGGTIIMRSDGVVELSLPLIFSEPGMYELLIIAKDLAGNTSPFSFKAILKVSSEIQPQLIVSPNPFWNFLKFSVDGLEKNGPLDSVILEIYDPNGKRIVRKEVDKKLREWFWYPEDRLPQGIYIYKILSESSDGYSQQFSGKVIHY
ncbi:putative type IX secretion system sortase PorU2 [Dyadobacter tibetensis]|uniref:putative type IX secretion system sortase PorU2 n=1 Tax=Dyadobacter tibetensis TaxID=1211851 RepID=UPI00046E554F|nr:C25 family cysteine peptidase [Dyadobacter tibetensis]